MLTGGNQSRDKTTKVTAETEPKSEAQILSRWEQTGPAGVA